MTKLSILHNQSHRQATLDSPILAYIKLYSTLSLGGRMDSFMFKTSLWAYALTYHSYLEVSKKIDF